MAQLDALGRPIVPSTWDGTDVPACGHYRIRLAKKGLWLPAIIAYEQLRDPDTGQRLDRWGPVLRILDWCWHRCELRAWQSSLHPITQADYELMCARELLGDPLETFNAGQSRLAL